MSGVRYSQQTTRLLERFPELRQAYASAVEQCRQSCPDIYVRATVQRGNTSLLFWLPDDVRGSGHWLLDQSDSSSLGTRYEWYMPVNLAGRIGDRRSTYYSDFPHPHYVRELFEHPIGDWSNSIPGEDPFLAVSSIIWVRRESWYPEAVVSDPTNESRLLTPPTRVEIQLTLFQRPLGGWRRLYRIADPFTNVSLVGSSLLPGGDLLRDHFVAVLYDRFNRLCIEFQDEVWDQGLGARINASRSRGMSGVYGSVTLLSYILAGRISLTFVRGDETFTMVGLERVSNPGLACGSVIGTAPHVEGLVREVIDFWHNADDETRRSVHKDDTSVGLEL